MHLRTGIPLLSELDAHLASEEYRRHVEFNRAFLARHDAAIQRYGKLWAKDTFRLWSRRWEYPFAAQRVIEFAEAQADGAVRILDAGSGVTYFPYYLCSEIARAEVTCLDSNPSYHEMFRAINESPSPQPSPGVPGEGEDRDAGVATTRGGEGNTSVAPT